MKIKLFALSFFTLFLMNAQDIQTGKFGKGILNLVGQDSSWTMKVAARFQLLGTSTFEVGEFEEDNNNQSSFLVRRARLKFDGYAFSPKLEYKLELGLSNRDQSGTSTYTSNTPRHVMDAVVKWNFYENFVLWVGQTKLPGNRERVISSGNLQMVDRSLLNSRFNIDRDMGVQLRHQFNLSDNFVVKEIFSLAQGEGRNVTTGNLGGYEYTGRIELFPMGDFESEGDYSGGDLKREETPKLSLAVAYDHNNNAVRNRGNQGTYMVTDTGFYETNVNVFFLDAMFKYNGFSLMAEYADRTAEDPIAKNSDGSLTGAIVQVGKGLNLQAGYLFKNNWEVSGRYTNIELDQNITGANPESQYTLGLSKYLVGHKLKVQTDISHLEVTNGTNELLYRLQFDIHF